MSLVLDGTSGSTGTGAFALANNPTLVTPNLGTPSSVNLTNATNVPVNQATGTLVVANGGTGVTTSTGSGSVVLGTSPTLSSPTFSGTPTGVGVLTSGTVVASTSGTSIDFTSLPSWVKRITVMFSGVSLSGTSNILIQIGAGSVQTTGYLSNSNYDTGPSGAGFSTTAGYGIAMAGAAINAISGLITITLLNSATGNWVESAVLSFDNAAAAGYTIQSAGTKTLSGTLDRVRITTVNGTDTFDAGSINILYE
jgi:hypothetical protein